MFSQYFWQSVAKGKEYQAKGKGWAGNDVKKYKNYIRDLVNLHAAKTLLDYGSGRGEQYSVPVTYPTELPGIRTEPMTFDKFIGIESVTQYDPCVLGIHVLPEITTKFDAVICTQVLGSIPDIDLPTVINLLSTYASKFCFVSLIDKDYNQPKESKINIYDSNYFKSNRTRNWYFNLFREHWDGPCCYLLFRAGQEYNHNWIDEETVAGTLLVLS